MEHSKNLKEFKFQRIQIILTALLTFCLKFLLIYTPLIATIYSSIIGVKKSESLSIAPFAESKELYLLISVCASIILSLIYFTEPLIAKLILPSAHTSTADDDRRFSYAAILTTLVFVVIWMIIFGNLDNLFPSTLGSAIIGIISVQILLRLILALGKTYSSSKQQQH